MTRDSIFGFLCLVCVIGELITGFSIPTLHWITGMVLLTALNFGD